MRFHGPNALLQFDKWYDHIYPIGAGGGIGQEIAASLFNGGISQDRLWEPGEDNLRIDNDEAIWVWAHGNRHRDAIEAGPNERFSPVSLAKALRKSLDLNSSGHLIIWTCWGGIAGGFVEQLAAVMGRGGYAQLRFWGSTELTGGLQRTNQNQWATVNVAANRQGRLDNLVRGPTAMEGVNYGFRPATQADMNGFGPGLLAPFLRAAEV